MGMFDRITFRCPQCDTEIEVQSKAGACNLNEYAATAVPIAIAADINHKPVECSACGKVWRIFVNVPAHAHAWLGQEGQILTIDGTFEPEKLG